MYGGCIEMDEKLKQIASLICETDSELEGSFIDPLENYQKSLQLQLRNTLKSFEERFYHGYTLLKK